MRRLTDELARLARTATVVGPELAAEPQRAAEQLSAYEAAGTRHVILPPTGTDWAIRLRVRSRHPRRRPAAMTCHGRLMTAPGCPARYPGAPAGPGRHHPCFPAGTVWG